MKQSKARMIDDGTGRPGSAPYPARTQPTMTITEHPTDEKISADSDRTRSEADAIHKDVRLVLRKTDLVGVVAETAVNMYEHSLRHGEREYESVEECVKILLDGIEVRREGIEQDSIIEAHEQHDE